MPAYKIKQFGKKIPGAVSIHVRVSPEEMDRIAILADNENRSRASLARIFMMSGMEEYERKLADNK